MTQTVVAIPTHRRASTILTHSLRQLRASSFPLADVHLFLSDAEDERMYRTSGASSGHTVHVCDGARSATEKFNAIHDAFSAGTRVLVMEDDVVAIAGVAGQNVKHEVPDLYELAKLGFGLSRGGLWGVTPHDNAFMFQKTVSYGLNLVVAHLFGFTASGDTSLRVTQRSKTDYERTLLYWLRDGFVCRVPGYGVRAASSYTLEGGMQAEMNKAARATAEAEAVGYLTSRFAHLCAAKEKASSPFAELRFKRPPADVVDWRGLQAVLDKRRAAT
jgi:hypothetical protein